MERLVTLCGVAVAFMVIGIFVYLGLESRYAFDRKFPYGYRFALQPASQSTDEPVELDPNATLITAHMDGLDGPDDKESIPMPTVGELEGIASTATGTALTGDLAKVDSSQLYRDDWRAWKSADEGDRFLLFAFSTKDCTDKTVRLRWEPDASFDPALAAHNFRIKLVRAPAGIDPPKVDIDLNARPSGSIELPTAVARSDDERTKAYVFEVVASPKAAGNVLATAAGLLRTEWAPTSQYPKYGIMPLVLATLIITLLALLFATMPAILSAVYLSEFASNRVREVAKPVIELIASVPTVVLGYFGLMIVAPGLMAALGSALSLESGRCLLTAALVMGVLILPTIVSVAEDGLRNLPNSFRDGGEALGLTRAETIRRVILPAARPALIGATMFGFARAMGETMVVWILSGGTPTMPSGIVKTLLQPARGIADTIGIEMANVEFEKPTYGHLFLLGLILFAITVAFNLIGNRLTKGNTWQH